MALAKSYDSVFEFYFSLPPSDILNQVSDDFNCEEYLKHTTAIVERVEIDVEIVHSWNFVYFTPVWE